MLKMAEIKLQLIPDPDMYIFFEKGSRGKISYISDSNLLHLMHVIAHTHMHASTCATSLMHVKIACTTSVYNTYCLGHWSEQNQRKTKIIRLSS